MLTFLNFATGDLVWIGPGYAPKWAPDDSWLVFICRGELKIFDINRTSLLTLVRSNLE